VQRVAQKYIDLNHLQVVAAGDASKTREVLAKFGSVEEYDSDGKPADGCEDGAVVREGFSQYHVRQRVPQTPCCRNEQNTRKL